MVLLSNITLIKVVEAVIATGKKNQAKWANPLTVLFPLSHRGLFSLPRFKCEMGSHPVFQLPPHPPLPQTRVEGFAFHFSLASLFSLSVIALVELLSTRSQPTSRFVHLS